VILKRIGKIIIGLIFVLAVLAVSFFYFLNRVNYSHGTVRESQEFVIEKGESNKAIGERLLRNNLIACEYYFYYYMWSHGMSGKIMPGEYEIPARFTIPEIAALITSEEEKNVKVTFPEGWTSKQMAERLNVNKLPGDDFLKIVNNSGELKNKYDFLKDSGNETLEGYLFPDTYFFAKDDTAEKIVAKMLGIFNTKVTMQMRSDAVTDKKTLQEIITMASIIEREVSSEEDRKTVSGIFWDRIDNSQALESCATISYILGVNKKQYSTEDTHIASPYNTYINRGLPPGPISNPGLSAITAAIYPEQTDYNYFLSDPETGETIFSRTHEEHTQNKEKYGL